MHILDRLSKDLAELMERELTQAKADPEHLYLSLLLLIGWQRRGGRSAGGSHTSSAATEPLEPTAEDDHDPTGEEEAGDEDSPIDNANLTELLRQSPFTHGNPYLSGLLFRDFHAGRTQEESWLPGLGPVKIHAEAALYVDEVLWLKTLGLATRNAGDEIRATNLHLLLLRLCRLSQAAGPWAETGICRRPNGKPMGLDVIWFRKTALALREQLKRLGDRIGMTARNRREASGPYWLETGDCAEIVGEELSLGDIVGIVPTPLPAGFAADTEFFELLRAVLQSLNEKYKWLRKCGLPPHDWLHRDEPSISRLKELALLRKRAGGSDTWTNGFTERAFREAFETARKDLAGKDRNQAKPPKKAEDERKLGGFARFDDWLDSGLGQAMLRDSPLSLSDLFSEGEDFDVEDRHPEAPAGTAETSELYAKILKDAGPRLARDPVLAAFFREVLVADRPFTGRGGLLEDSGFQALLARGYAGLTAHAVSGAFMFRGAARGMSGFPHPDPLPEGEGDKESLRDAFMVTAEELAERLYYQARSLIAEVLQESAEATAPEAVLKYLRWVLIQEKPCKTLFKHKAFQAALAQEPALRDLPEAELAERLHGESLRLLARWLDGDD